MDNKETKNLCLKLINAQDCMEVVEVLKKYNFWDHNELWRLYGDKEGSWATINNQGNPPFALTEKITNSVDAILMNRCFESGKHPKSEDRTLPKSPREAVHKYFESRDEIKKYDIDKSLFDENIDDVAGLQEFWGDKKARDVANNINIDPKIYIYKNLEVSSQGCLLEKNKLSDYWTKYLNILEKIRI